MFFARFRLYLEDFVAEGDEISDSTPVHYELRFVFENIHKKVKKGQKQVTNGKFYLFARFRLFFGDFVAEGDEITGRRTVHHE